MSRLPGAGRGIAALIFALSGTVLGPQSLVEMQVKVLDAAREIARG